jgi:hypothetical protein
VIIVDVFVIQLFIIQIILFVTLPLSNILTLQTAKVVLVIGRVMGSNMELVAVAVRFLRIHLVLLAELQMVILPVHTLMQD